MFQSKVIQLVTSISVVMLVAACAETGTEMSTESSIDLSNIDALVARGEELYTGAGECYDCHGRDGRGVDAPS